MTTVRDRAMTARRDDRAAVGWAWTGRNLILDEALEALSLGYNGITFCEFLLTNDRRWKADNRKLTTPTRAKTIRSPCLSYNFK